MKLCKSCAESLHELFTGRGGDASLWVARIADQVRETLNPPPVEEPVKKSKAKAAGMIEGAKA